MGFAPDSMHAFTGPSTQGLICRTYVFGCLLSTLTDHDSQDVAETVTFRVIVLTVVRITENASIVARTGISLS